MNFAGIFLTPMLSSDTSLGTLTISLVTLEGTAGTISNFVPSIIQDLSSEESENISSNKRSSAVTELAKESSNSLLFLLSGNIFCGDVAAIEGLGVVESCMDEGVVEVTILRSRFSFPAILRVNL